MSRSGTKRDKREGTTQMAVVLVAFAVGVGGGCLYIAANSGFLGPRGAETARGGTATPAAGASNHARFAEEAFPPSPQHDATAFQPPAPTEAMAEPNQDELAQDQTAQDEPAQDEPEQKATWPLNLYPPSDDLADSVELGSGWDGLHPGEGEQHADDHHPQLVDGGPPSDDDAPNTDAANADVPNTDALAETAASTATDERTEDPHDELVVESVQRQAASEPSLHSATSESATSESAGSTEASPHVDTTEAELLAERIGLEQEVARLQAELKRLREAEPPAAAADSAAPAPHPSVADRTSDSVSGQATLHFWNLMNAIIRTEAGMRSAPRGGLTADNTGGFLVRRQRAYQYAAERIAGLPTAGVDPQALAVAEDVRKWYLSGLEVTTQALSLMDGGSASPRGAAGVQWSQQERAHNAAVRQVNARAEQARQTLMQQHNLYFPHLE